MIDYELDRRTIGQMLRSKAELIPDSTYLAWGDSEFNYGEVEQLTNALASGLSSYGIGRGTHVALVMDNCPEYLWTTYALGKLGAVVVPINTAAKGQLMNYLLTQSDCEYAVVDDGYVVAVRSAAPQIPIISRPDGSKPADLAAPTLPEILAAGDSARETPPDVEVSFRDPWFIMYTSGTTGPSKGVVCPQAHPLTVASCMVRSFGLESADRLFAFLPLFHANALWYSSLTALSAEASVALAPRFSASRFWSEVHQYQVTEFNAIMSVATILEKLKPSAEEKDNPVRIAFIVPLPVKRAELEERWQLEFTCNYSMTELVPAAMLGPGDGHGKGNTSGRTVDYVEMQIVDENDRPQPPDTPGEIVVRPREPWTTFSGYYKKPEDTADAMRNVWFHTGDRGMLDADGYFYFVDRIKDAIRRRGENISAHEIEMIMETCDGIAEAAAVPLPSELGEDEVALYAVPATPGLTELEIVEFARGNLAYFMVPRFVRIIDELPKTPTHKKAKNVLRERALTESDAFWDREEHGVEVQRPVKGS